ncbi:G5 domain-containing protein [Peptococcaceae bacterium]|nr:G5 domain-containing protein [Peptococcaceae bacterium]MCL0106466.1 G5 domain-containing protein [Peptococcaceae bacterium]
MICSKVENGKITVKIFGNIEDAQNISYKTETVRKVIKHDTIYKISKNLKPGEMKIINPGRDGYEIKIFKLTVINGIISERELVDYQYVKPINAVIVLPPERKAKK